MMKKVVYNKNTKSFSDNNPSNSNEAAQKAFASVPKSETITVKSGKYSKAFINITLYSVVPEEFIYARDQMKLFGALYLILGDNSPKFNIEHHSRKVSDSCKELFEKYKDELLAPQSISFDRIVNLLDYNLGPYEGEDLSPMTIREFKLNSGKNRNYFDINSLNAPDKYLYRFIIDLIQKQEFDGKIYHNNDSYGIGHIDFEFSAGKFNFDLVIYGGCDGYYSGIGVDKIIDSWDFPEFMKSLGYNKNNLPDGCPKNIIRDYYRR